MRNNLGTNCPFPYLKWRWQQDLEHDLICQCVGISNWNSDSALLTTWFFIHYFFFFPFYLPTVIALSLSLSTPYLPLLFSLYSIHMLFLFSPTFFLCLVFSFLSTLFPSSFLLFTQLLILFSRFTQFGSILCVSFQMQTFYMLHFQLLADYSEISNQIIHRKYFLCTHFFSVSNINNFYPSLLFSVSCIKW